MVRCSSPAGANKSVRDGAVVAPARRHFVERAAFPDVVNECYRFHCGPPRPDGSGGHNGTFPKSTKVKPATDSTAIAVPTMIEILSGGFRLSGAFDLAFRAAPGAAQK
jgi:hypothetical protein